MTNTNLYEFPHAEIRSITLDQRTSLSGPPSACGLVGTELSELEASHFGKDVNEPHQAKGAFSFIHAWRCSLSLQIRVSYPGQETRKPTWTDKDGACLDGGRKWAPPSPHCLLQAVLAHTVTPWFGKAHPCLHTSAPTSSAPLLLEFYLPGSGHAHPASD